MADVEIKKFDWQSELYDSSRRIVDIGISLVEQQPELFTSLFELALSQCGKYSLRALRIVCYLFERDPDKYDKYLDIILYHTEKETDESKKFNFLRIFKFCKLPEDDEKLGLLTNICLNALESQVKRIAVKVYSIDILYRISLVYPELNSELIYYLEKYMIDSSPAFFSRASKILVKLKKELKITN
jgi:hypothetical protein